MRRWKIAIIFVVSLALTGCIKKYDISDEKSDAIAEYIAGKLLEEDTGYNQKLLKEEPGYEAPTIAVIATPAPTPTTIPITTNVPNATPAITPGSPLEPNDIHNQKYTLTEVFGVSSFNITYKDYKVTDHYTYNFGTLKQHQTPRDGYEYLVVNFSIKNKSKETRPFTLIKNEVQYTLTDDNGVSFASIFTLKENDIQYINLPIDSGKTIDALILFEIPKNDKLTKATLEVIKDNKASTIKLNK